MSVSISVAVGVDSTARNLSRRAAQTSPSHSCKADRWAVGVESIEFVEGLRFKRASVRIWLRACESTPLLGRQHAFPVAEQRPFLALPSVGEPADAIGAALGVGPELQRAALLVAIHRGRVGQAGDLAPQGHVDRRRDLVALGVERLQRIDTGREVLFRLTGTGGLEPKDP